MLTFLQDTLDLREDLAPEDQGYQQYDDRRYTSDEEHSVMEDDDEQDGDGEFLEDDDRSSVSEIPDPSIDFDLVYSLHAFVATVEGQANVAKGDSLFLMDDSNSYWWLVRVLKSQEVGYIPAENIETPHERLARLNKHRNVDVCRFIVISNVFEAHSLFRSLRARRNKNGRKTLVLFASGIVVNVMAHHLFHLQSL